MAGTVPCYGPLVLASTRRTQMTQTTMPPGPRVPRLMQPPFHGERMKSYEGIIEQEAEREMATWPAERSFRTLEPFSRITLNAIIRAVFGAQEQDADDLRRLLPDLVARGSRLALLPFLHHDAGASTPWGRFLRRRAEVG